MLTVAFKRITKSGFINFWRNGFVSLSSLSIMAVTLVVLGILMFASALFNASLLQLKDKVDINKVNIKSISAIVFFISFPRL